MSTFSIAARALRNTAIAATATAVMMVGGASVAQATVASVGGGTWNYGVTTWTASNNWSHYYHPSRYHGSSVTGDVGLVRSGCGIPGTYTYTWAWDSNPFRIDSAYWRYC